MSVIGNSFVKDMMQVTTESILSANLYWLLSLIC